MIIYVSHQVSYNVFKEKGWIQISKLEYWKQFRIKEEPKQFKSVHGLLNHLIGLGVSVTDN